MILYTVFPVLVVVSPCFEQLFTLFLSRTLGPCVSRVTHTVIFQRSRIFKEPEKQEFTWQAMC